MSFDFDKFDAAQFTFPTKKIPVPELKSFFPEDAVPVWEVKGLTGHELAIVNQAVETGDKIQAFISALKTGKKAELKKGFETFLDKNDDVTPADLVRRHKMLELGSVPACPEHISVKLAHFKTTTFWKITNEIITMTGEGADAGE